MSPENTNGVIAEQVELAVSKAGSLSAQDAPALRVFAEFLKPTVSTDTISNITEADAPLSAKILSVCQGQGVSFAQCGYSIRRVIEKLPSEVLREAVLAVGGADSVSWSTEAQSDRPWRKELSLHNLAVACCAERIAEISNGVQVNPKLAYMAGLLHDIGKLAVEQQMPKSFRRIVEQSRLNQSLICQVERKYLGSDHTVLGKRLGQNWRLPSEIVSGIWLHHSGRAVLSGSVPHSEVAQIVCVADIVARQCEIGDSGSYDKPEIPDLMLDSLGLSNEQLAGIRESLPGIVKQRQRDAGIDSPVIEMTWLETLQAAAGRLSRENSKLLYQNRSLQGAASQLNFLNGFIEQLGDLTDPLAVVEVFGLQWQKFYQTGAVCVYLADFSARLLPAVVINCDGQARTTMVETDVSEDSVDGRFENQTDWLVDQLYEEFDPDRTRILSLKCGAETVAAAVFEERHPANFQNESVGRICDAAGTVIKLTKSGRTQERLAEKFVELLVDTGSVSAKASDDLQNQQTEQVKPDQQGKDQPFDSSESLLEILSEVAAGAAHELNNPLSVIAGRAQLLANSEADENKNQMLQQIQENATEISQIANDLMGFARPPRPRKAACEFSDILNDARDLATMKLGIESLDLQVESESSVGKVYVDSAQVVSAIANILTNAYESYGRQGGTVYAKVAQADSRDYMIVRISDEGRGMDSETLSRCTYPFYSQRSAGRGRGMGLAHSHRLIELNEGSLSISSRVDEGTAVTIHLPAAV